MFVFYTSAVTFMFMFLLQALCFIQIRYIKRLLYMLDIIPLCYLYNSFVQLTSPLVTDDFLRAMGLLLSTLCFLVPCLYSHILYLFSETPK